MNLHLLLCLTLKKPYRVHKISSTEQKYPPLAYYVEEPMSVLQEV